MKRRLPKRRNCKLICAGGGLLLTLSVLSSVAIGFSTFLIGTPFADVGPLSATVGTIVYSQIINFSDIGLSFDGESPEGPTFAVVGSSSSSVLFGSPVFEVEGKVQRSKLIALDYYDDLSLKVSFLLRGGNVVSCNYVKTMSVSLSNYDVYGFEYEGVRSISASGALTEFTIPVKTRSERSLWTLIELDAVDSYASYSPISFSFSVDASSLDEASLVSSSFSVSFSLVQVNL